MVPVVQTSGACGEAEARLFFLAPSCVRRRRRRNVFVLNALKLKSISLFIRLLFLLPSCCVELDPHSNF